MTPIVVTHRQGQQFCAQVGTHELVLDQPPAGGGEDAGPSPIELLGAALGGCVALYVHRFLATRRIDAQGLRVEVTQRSARNPHRIVRFEVHIVVPGGVPDLYRPMIESFSRVCPVHNTLAPACEIAVTVEMPRAPDATPSPPFATADRYLVPME